MQNLLRIRYLGNAPALLQAHAFFLQCRYTDVFETYIGKGFYLDAASWAAVGQVDRAATLLRTRVTQPQLGAMMYDMMASLLAVLEDRCSDALALIEKADFTPDPEGLFYLAVTATCSTPPHPRLPRDPARPRGRLLVLYLS